MELDVFTQSHSILKDHLQDIDKQKEIELYYELLSSGHSVGEILNAVGPTQQKSEHGESAKLKQSQLELGGASTVVSEGALVNAMAVKVLSSPQLHITPASESCGASEPQVGRDRWLDGTGSVDEKHHLQKNIPRVGINIVKSSGTMISIDHESTPDSKRPRLASHGFPKTTKRAAFVVFCAMAALPLLIAGFSIMYGKRDAVPMTTAMPLQVTGRTAATTIVSPVAPRSEVAVRFSTPQKGPLSGPPQKIEAGGQGIVSTLQLKVDGSQRLTTSQPMAIEQLAEPATASRDPERGSTTSVLQFPSTPPAESVEIAARSDTRQPDMRKLPEATPKNGAKATLTVASGTASAALPSRANDAKRHKAGIARHYAELRRRVRRPASMYYGQSRGWYYSNFDRGYSYGGPAPHSDTGG